MLKEAQAKKEKSNKGVHSAYDPLHSFFDGLDSSALEDFSGLGDLEVSKKDTSSQAGGPSSTPKLINQFLAPGMDPGHKRSVILTVSEDARVLSAF